MGKSSRDKGARRERQIVEMHRVVGIKAERVPLSGAMAFRNTRQSDVDVYANGPDSAQLVPEVKARADGGGFKQIETWLGENDALFLMRDRAEPLVTLPWRTWQSLILKASK